MKKQSIKNWFGKKSPGETLLEVIVALLVISMGAATATGLIITAVRANVFNKDSLIALNLAQEGLEYMRNLRDSDWLAYSADTQHCWNMVSSSGACVSPYTTNVIVEANPANATSKGFALGAYLTAAIAYPLDLSPSGFAESAGYLISYWDTDPTVSSDPPDINTINDKDIMASVNSPLATGWTQGVATKYYRSIETQYYTIGASPDWPLTAAASPQLADMMIVTSRVQWLDGTTVNQVSLSSALARYK